MQIRTFRSLDRSIQYFGIKGRFVRFVLMGGGVSLIVAALVGSATNGLVGLGVFLILAFVCVMVIISIQGTTSEKAFFRRIAMWGRRGVIHIKPIKYLNHGNE